MKRLSPYPVREKVTDDVDWEKIPEKKWEMNFRPLRDHQNELKDFKRIVFCASVFAAVALVAISVLNAFFPFLFGNSETLFLLLFAAAVPFVLAWNKPQLETGIELYGTLVLLLLISNLGLLFLGGYRDEFYSTIFVAVAVPFVLFNLDSVASMYVHRTTASPRMDRDAMFFLRNVWNERFGRGLFVSAKAPTKGRVGEPDQIATSMRRIANYPAYLLAVFLVCFISIFGVQLFATNSIAQAGLITSSVLIVGVAAWMASRDKASVATVLSALMLFATGLTFRKEPGTIQYQRKYRLRLNLVYSTIMMMSFAVNTFWFPWALGSFATVGSTTHLLLNIAIQFLVVFALGPVLVFAMAVIAIGPVLREFELLCETEDALLSQKGWTEFDGYSDRLSKSGIAEEAECIWIGFHEQREFPILIPVDLLNQHVHVLGGSGAGKTGLGLSTLAAQMIKQNQGPVIIIDGKGDNSLFQSTRRWCDEEKRKLKWFTTGAEKSTYLFNPLEQKAIETFSLSDIVGFLLQSLNLFHGSDYGRGWFTQASKTALAEAAKLKREGHPRPATLALFCKHLEEAIRQEKQLAKPALHVLFMLQTLAEFPQLNNARPKDDPDKDSQSHPACEHAIDMLEVIKKNQVVYFGFDSITDPSSTGELSRIAVYSIMAAARLYEQETKQKPNITVIVDEAQHIVASNITNAVELARTLGIYFVFSHQERSQLKVDSGTDLRAVFDVCTQVKLYFDAEGETIKHIRDISGEVGYIDNSWQQFASDVIDGSAALSYAVGKDGEPALTDVTMRVGPRLTLNEIQDASASTNTCILAVKRRIGLAQYRGAFPIHIDYPISEAEFAENQRLRWPPKSDETIESLPLWPKIEDETVVRDETPEPESPDVEGDLKKFAAGIFDPPIFKTKPPNA